MDKVKYVIKNNLDMDAMHDSYASEIRIEENCLLVVYDNLDEGVLDSDGKPYYQNKRLTIRYEFDSYCDAKVYYKDNVSTLWTDEIDIDADNVYGYVNVELKYDIGVM